ncbi:hypothetical protein FO611_05840 [Riemerella anatipestifer]|nr:hypothetical protein [Riemerella anatipestifer]MDD1553963.1 hypothetical protein [Riemerella anatipestifer]MDD1596862.1 hypothetical protein [Riemerella anatipestifer]MSN81456.1 hypothetical protein [Riemerella anatipestifer]MSN87931.1 hypothetical protein [Riemerella anatipestifer]
MRFCFSVLLFLTKLAIRKKHPLRLVEIELFVQFSPPFANTFPVVGNAKKTTRHKKTNRKNIVTLRK